MSSTQGKPLISEQHPDSWRVILNENPILHPASSALWCVWALGGLTTAQGCSTPSPRCPSCCLWLGKVWAATGPLPKVTPACICLNHTW